MWEINFSDLQKMYSEEVLNLCSINERFDSEPEVVKDIRSSFANSFMILTELRDKAWRSEAWRNFAISITELENSCMRAVKWAYSK